MESLSVSDAERVIEGLRSFSVSEIGSDAWLEQHEVIERLNLQSVGAVYIVHLMSLL